MNIPTEVWAPVFGLLVAVLGYLGGRAQSDATSAAAWRQLLAPYREEQERLWDRVAELEKANAVLTTQREADRQELGVLRRAQRDQAIRSTADTAALRTKLADVGIEVPDVRVAPLPLDRTRITDRE